MSSNYDSIDTRNDLETAEDIALVTEPFNNEK